MSGFGFGTRSGLHRLGHASRDPLITISAFAISEQAQPGSTVGALSVLGGNGTYAFAIPAGGDPDDKFSLNGSNLELAGPLDFETSPSHRITIEADNGVDPVLSRDLVIGVTNAFEQPDLAPLSLPVSITSGSIVPISGATDGSTIAAVVLPTGWTLDGPSRQIAIASDAPTGAQSWFLIETLADSANSPNVTSGSSMVQGASVLNVLALSSSVISEGSSTGTQIGAVQNATAGSTLSLLDSAGDRFAVLANNVVRGDTALDFEAATSHQITIRETLASASNSPRDTVLTISVSNVFEQPDLGALALGSAATQGSVVAISGATAGSSITANSLPQGWTLDSANRLIEIAADAPTGPQSWSLTETLADSSNSPNTSSGTTIVEPMSGASFDPVEAGFVLFDSRDIAQNGAVSSWQAKGGRGTVSSNSSSEQPTKTSAGVSFDGIGDILTDAGRSFGSPVATYNIDAVWHASPLGDPDQFTNTGITRAPDGTWWLVNHPAGAPSRSDGILVRFSADFSTVLETIDLGAVYGVGTIGGPQGIVYDTDDDTLWFTSALMNRVKHIRTDGTPLPADDIVFPSPAGLAIDQAQGTLIILESEGSASNQNAGIMRTVNKSTGATVASGTLTDHPDWDQIHFDQDSRALFVTGGYEYAGQGDTYVSIYSMDGPNYLRQLSFIRTPEPDAIEGIAYHDGKLYINNDAGFHGGASGVNEVVEYDVGAIVGTKIIFAAALQVQGNSGTDAIIGLDFPISAGEYGHALLVGGSSDIRLFNRSGPTGESTNVTFNTDTPNLAAARRIVTGIFDPGAASDVRMWIDGIEVTGTISGGAQNSFTGPITDRVNLAIGGVLDGNTRQRQSQIDVMAIGYGVRAPLASDNRVEIEGWLAHQFGLVDQLPAGHPYKGAAP